MKIKKLFLHQFRNYLEQEIIFENRITFISGKNAYGKTNILEAIGILSHGKSFRDCPFIWLIMEDKQQCSIRAQVENVSLNKTDKLLFSLEKKNQKISKNIRINNKLILSRKDLIGRLQVVYFTPTDIQLIDGNPSVRRRFFDSIIGVSDKSYLNALINYNRIISQRNSLLKKGVSLKMILQQLEVWDNMLYDIVAIIKDKRKKFLLIFQDHFLKALEKISQKTDSMVIENENLSLENMDDYFIKLKERHSRDFYLGFTSVGPHRDLYLLTRNGQSIHSIVSQGQKRSIALALRYAQYEFLYQQLQLKPILLIDDVIRELDKDRCFMFIELLTKCGQVIITTPEINESFQGFMNVTDSLGVIHLSEPAKPIYKTTK